ncbi:MAG: STN domain-containing protein, partial [Bacteroidota bacterium]
MRLSSISILSTALFFLIFFIQSATASPQYFSQAGQLQPLADLLDELSEHHDISIIYKAGEVKGKNSTRPDQWHTNPEADLKYLLKNKPLTYNKINTSTFVILAKPKARLNIPTHV